MLHVVMDGAGDLPPGESILSMHVTSKLSGTFNSAKMAAREIIEEFHVYTLDSISVAANLGPGTIGIVAYPD